MSETMSTLLESSEYKREALSLRFTKDGTNQSCLDAHVLAEVETLV